MKGVYLIHFEKKLGRCQHYLGWSRDIDKRFEYHLSNKGSALLREANRRGIKYSIVKVWKDKDGNFEQALKKRKNHKFYCPICKS